MRNCFACRTDSSGRKPAAPGRPYRLHTGDQVQVRRGIHHSRHGPLRNGTTATITTIDPHTQTARLRLDSDAELRLSRRQLELADVRLAYAHHPFPAQGATSDTAHLVLTDHTTRAGAYVALTRARHSTHIYAAFDKLTTDPDTKPIERLTELITRTEPELPSIDTPIAHEQRIEHDTTHDAQTEKPPYPSGARPDAQLGRTTCDTAANTISDHRKQHNMQPTEPTPLAPPPAADRYQQRVIRQNAAAQLDMTPRELGGPDVERQPAAEIEPEQDRGWEP